MKVKYSGIMSDARGKLNGSVASKNRYGQYLRNKITPTNPQTSSQVAQRAKLATFASKWRSLTPAQRLAWNNAVGNYTGTNIFGDVTTPSGNVLYNRLNMTLATVNEDSINLPPLPLGASTPEELDASVNVSTGLAEITILPNSVPTDHKLVIESTAPLSAGIFNANNQFRIVSVDPSLTAGVADIFDAIEEKFGTPTAGLKMFFKVSFYRTDTGEKSQSLKTSTIVVG